MSESVVNVFGVGADFGSDGVGGFWLGGEVATNLAEEIEENTGGFLARLDAWLVVGVDVDQRSVEGDGALEEGDELAESAGVDLWDGDGDGAAAAFVEGFAGSTEEALQEVGGGDAGLDFDGVTCASLADFDEGGEEVVDAVAELLDVGVLVGGAFVSVNGDPLVYFFAVEIELFSE